ncbi:MAG TPA: EF-P lysine aminoacylase EpmA [Luteibacter sp.]|uniref:EF-P lysine aminoacylase EpmA n=1 Tax=Luteibacter sp. TaxID=1886636 RepID=UPI002F3E8350
MSQDLKHLRLRAATYARIRDFFAERGVLEVETPMLSAAGNTDPNIQSFHTRFTGHVDAGAAQRWMRTSPEFPLKRLLAAGLGDCYELGRVFRDGEAGGRHNPEFTMLEWYRVGWDDARLAREVIDLLEKLMLQAGRTFDIVETTYRGLFHDAVGVDALSDSIEVLQAAMGDVHINGEGLTRDDWLDLLMTHRIQPTFTRDRITVVSDFPASQCALARIRKVEPPVAERFEVYVGPYEVANGYHELNDAQEQRSRFERDNAVRRERGQHEVPMDENLLAVLGNLPDCAGVALGVERLLMVLADTDRIADVLAFPFDEA